MINCTLTRDSVCETVESLLNDLENRGMGKLEKKSVPDNVQLSFGDIQVEAATFDVGLIRMAMSMIEDERYSALVLKALRAPILKGG